MQKHAFFKQSSDYSAWNTNLHTPAILWVTPHPKPQSFCQPMGLVMVSAHWYGTTLHSSAPANPGCQRLPTPEWTTSSSFQDGICSGILERVTICKFSSQLYAGMPGMLQQSWLWQYRAGRYQYAHTITTPHGLAETSGLGLRMTHKMGGV